MEVCLASGERSLLKGDATQLWGSTHNCGAGLLQEEHHHDGVACSGHPWH